MEAIQVAPDLVFVVAPLNQTEAILRYANEQGWDDAKKVGKGGKIYRSIRSKNWIVMPIEHFPGIIPSEGKKRMETMKKNFAISKFLIADDPNHPRYQKKQQEENRKKMMGILKVVGLIGLSLMAIPVIAMVVGALMVAAIIAVMTLVSFLASGAVIIGALVFAPFVLAYDPLIIAVTEDDGTWICFYEYWD